MARKIMRQFLNDGMQSVRPTIAFSLTYRKRLTATRACSRLCPAPTGTRSACPQTPARSSRSASPPSYLRLPTRPGPDRTSAVAHRPLAFTAVPGSSASPESFTWISPQALVRSKTSVPVRTKTQTLEGTVRRPADQPTPTYICGLRLVPVKAKLGWEI